LAWLPQSHFIHLLIKMEQKVCSETSAYQIETPRNYKRKHTIFWIFQGGLNVLLFIPRFLAESFLVKNEVDDGWCNFFLSHCPRLPIHGFISRKLTRWSWTLAVHKNMKTELCITVLHACCVVMYWVLIFLLLCHLGNIDKSCIRSKSG